MQFLILQGMNSNLVSARGFSSGNLIASNDRPEGRAQDRRRCAGR